MTAHLLALICWIMPGVPTPKPALAPIVPTDAQIFQEAQRRANQFCTVDYVYPDGMVPLIVPCEKPVLDCLLTVTQTDYPYDARCTGLI